MAGYRAVRANSRMAEWTAQQLLQAFPWDEAPRFLLRDRDYTYGKVFRETAAGLASRKCCVLRTHPGRRLTFHTAPLWSRACSLFCCSR